MGNAQNSQLAELRQRLIQGQLSRREFIRAATLLGLSLGAGGLLSACSPEAGSDANASIPPTSGSSAAGYKPAPTFTPQPEVEWIGRTVPTATPRGTYSPEWYCGACGQHFPSLDMFLTHAASNHAWRLPEIKKVEEPTYQQFVVGPIERFDEKNTIFCRADWDESYQKLINEVAPDAPRDAEVTVEGKALVAGAIFVDNKSGAQVENYYGYSGHVRGAGGLYDWDEPVNPDKFRVTDPQWMTERVKYVARKYGASLVGVTELDQRWVYSDYFERATQKYGKLELPYKYAIMMAVEMDWAGINESPGFEASAATALGYSKMAIVSASVAAYIRGLGYPAIPSGNDSAQNIPLAIDAGLGELGRLGLLLTPEFGPRQRLCKVFTNLPLVPDKPIDFGIQSFCEICHACAAACPASAIRWDDRTPEPTCISNRTGINRWVVSVERCYLFWRQNGVDCSNCIAACPWSIQSQRDWLDL